MRGVHPCPPGLHQVLVDDGRDGRIGRVLALAAGPASATGRMYRVLFTDTGAEEDVVESRVRCVGVGLRVRVRVRARVRVGLRVRVRVRTRVRVRVRVRCVGLGGIVRPPTLVLTLC